MVAPNENLCDGPERLDQEAPVPLGHGLVLGQHGVEVPEIKTKKTAFTRLKIQSKLMCDYCGISYRLNVERQLVWYNYQNSLKLHFILLL